MEFERVGRDVCLIIPALDLAVQQRTRQLLKSICLRGSMRGIGNDDHYLYTGSGQDFVNLIGSDGFQEGTLDGDEQISWSSFSGRVSSALRRRGDLLSSGT